jgi:hypothetical protein
MDLVSTLPNTQVSTEEKLLALSHFSVAFPKAMGTVLLDKKKLGLALAQRGEFKGKIAILTIQQIRDNMKDDAKDTAMLAAKWKGALDRIRQTLEKSTPP